MGHVNNSVYLKWVQDAVVDYWQRVAPAEAVARHLWVALKHEITYRKPDLPRRRGGRRRVRRWWSRGGSNP
jgi:acyl-CoA thioesterase FadM